MFWRVRRQRRDTDPDEPAESICSSWRCETGNSGYGCGTTILGIGFALVEALAVTVVKGDVTYRGPTVLDESIRYELGHGISTLFCIT